MSVCAHCGQDPGITYGTITLHVGVMKLCHTGYPDRPDCYRRVTVYHEPLSILKNVSPLPAGVEDIHDPGVSEILKLYRKK